LQNFQKGSSAVIQQHGAEWLLTDPKTDVRDSEIERPFLAEGCPSPASQKRSIV